MRALAERGWYRVGGEVFDAPDLAALAEAVDDWLRAAYATRAPEVASGSPACTDRAGPANSTQPPSGRWLYTANVARQIDGNTGGRR
jgi:hypothetical protein